MHFALCYIKRITIKGDTNESKKTVTSLTRNGYIVSVFRTKEEAVHYLNEQIDHTSVGIGGSVTLQQMDIYEQLAAHNEVFRHWHNTDGSTADDTRRAARICNAMVIPTGKCSAAIWKSF